MDDNIEGDKRRLGLGQSFPLLGDRPCARPLLGTMAVLRSDQETFAPDAVSGRLILPQAEGLAYKVLREFVNSFLMTSRCRARPNGQVTQYLLSGHAARVAANAVDVVIPHTCTATTYHAFNNQHPDR